MNWKLPNQLRWCADYLREAADLYEEAAKELETLRSMVVHEPIGGEIEEGDRANG